MRDGKCGSFGFWVACASPEDFDGPLVVGPDGSDAAVAVFSFEEEALLYLRLGDRDGDFRPIRVSGARLLSERWSVFGSVALDPVPKSGVPVPLTATSRERFSRFLLSRGKGQTWAWLLGVAVAGGAVAALLWSRLVGLPGYPDGVHQWFNFSAWMALAFELPFLAVAGLALTRRGKTLVGVEQRRIDMEQLPPDRQQTPEHFRLIEGQMQEIRNRMAPDIQDLRLHLDPKARKEKVERNVRERVEKTEQDIRTRLRSLLRRD